MAYEAFGSDLYKGAGVDYSSETSWTSVGCVTAITPPSDTVNKIELPVCLNAATRVKTIKPGAVSPGEATYTILFAAGDIDTAIAELGDFGCWLIKLSDSNKSMVFNGFFSGFSMPEINENGFISVTATIQKSGPSDEIATPAAIDESSSGS